MLAARVRFLSVVGGAFALCLVAIPGHTALAQPGGGGFGGGFGGGGLALYSNKNVVDELEMTDDQVKDIKAITDKVSTDIRALFPRGGGGGGGGGGRGGLSEEVQEKMKTINEEAQAEIKKILLPGQVKRFAQLEFQQRAGRSLTSDAAVKALDISDDQKEALTEKFREINAKVDKEIGKLRAEAKAELVKSLNAKQQATYKELAGEPFDFGNQGFGGFGGGGFGGFGGQPGGGQPGGGRRPGGQGTRPQ